MNKISLEKMASLIKNYWAPLDLFQVNDVKVRLVKLKGKYHWHQHADEDEMFMVLKGKLTIHFRGKDVTLLPGECFLVEKGIEHLTESTVDTLAMLVEPAKIITSGS